MTALPPTIGHGNLIKFAANLSDEVRVILNTMPHEPYVHERYKALVDFVEHNFSRGHVLIIHINEVMPQAPEECDSPEEFWDMWHKILTEYGFHPDDYIVASEPYGIALAEAVQGIFMPYDPYRDIHFTKATSIRDNPSDFWEWMLFEFQGLIRPRVTFFGAESCGKTTTSADVAKVLSGAWIAEYARPYLEMVGNEITVESMTAIWQGQKAYQDHAQSISRSDTCFISQDTDLFSTIGYWKMWDISTLPKQLELDAIERKSDLYIIMDTNIPFEEDVLRYGGSKRESDTQYWVDLCEHYDLNYVVVKSESVHARCMDSAGYVIDLLNDVQGELNFRRTYNG